MQNEDQIPESWQTLATATSTRNKLVNFSLPKCSLCMPLIQMIANKSGLSSPERTLRKEPSPSGNTADIQLLAGRFPIEA